MEGTLSTPYYLGFLHIPSLDDFRLRPKHHNWFFANKTLEKSLWSFKLDLLGVMLVSRRQNFFVIIIYHKRLSYAIKLSWHRQTRIFMLWNVLNEQDKNLLNKKDISLRGSMQNIEQILPIICQKWERDLTNSVSIRHYSFSFFVYIELRRAFKPQELFKNHSCWILWSKWYWLTYCK